MKYSCLGIYFNSWPKSIVLMLYSTSQVIENSDFRFLIPVTVFPADLKFSIDRTKNSWAKFKKKCTEFIQPLDGKSGKFCLSKKCLLKNSGVLQLKNKIGNTSRAELSFVTDLQLVCVQLLSGAGIT